MSSVEGGLSSVCPSSQEIHMIQAKKIARKTHMETGKQI